MSDAADRPPQALDRAHVVVLGAGLSGLAAAHVLRAQGARTTVLERGHRPGGRATSEARDGFRIESAPHWVSARDRQLLDLVQAVGLGSRMLPLKPMALAQVRRGKVEAIDPTGTRGVRSIPGVGWRQGLRVHRLDRLLRKFEDILTPDVPANAIRMDDRSIADFVRTYFGRSVLERWVEPLVSADVGGADVNEASRQLFLLHRVGRAFAPEGAFRAGVGELAEALAAGLDVRLESEAVALEREGNGFVLTTGHGGQEQRIEADAVVSALPSRTAARVLDRVLVPAERDALRAGRTAPAIVASLAIEGEPVRKATRVRVPAAEGMAAAVIALEPGAPFASAPEGTTLATVVARTDWSRAHLEAADDVVEKALVGAVERLYGRLDLRFVTLRRHREAFPRFDVGRYRTLASLARVEADRTAQGRRLFHAGDQLVAPTLQGAVVSGRRAAARAAEALRRGVC